MTTTTQPSQPVSGVVSPPFADSTFPCFGSWSMESEECARCNRCGTCMAHLFKHLFNKGELLAQSVEAFA